MFFFFKFIDIYGSILSKRPSTRSLMGLLHNVLKIQGVIKYYFPDQVLSLLPEYILFLK